jgi:hypothetical protein
MRRRSLTSRKPLQCCRFRPEGPCAARQTPRRALFFVLCLRAYELCVRVCALLRFSCHTLHPADSVYGSGHGLETLEMTGHFPVSDLGDIQS